MNKFKKYFLREKFFDMFFEAVFIGSFVLLLSNHLENLRQQRMYEDSSYFEILKIRYDDKKTLTEDFSRLTETRYFYSESYYEAILSGNISSRLLVSYKYSVDEWNIRKNYLRLNLATYFR